MTQHQTKINGYQVDLDDDMEGDGKVTDCRVTYKGEHDTFTASLACLVDTGVLTAPSGRETEVAYKTIDRIEEWAEKNGY